MIFTKSFWSCQLVENIAVKRACIPVVERSNLGFAFIVFIFLISSVLEVNLEKVM